MLTDYAENKMSRIRDLMSIVEFNFLSLGITELYCFTIVLNTRVHNN